ncbi:hypothetical protein E2C01_056768 [Portunus trituberculatus]|uniref:Uncharacterized protein n=2 Tax=Portunus trituberculatus TaxID=210409 RepID=A0A5B7GYN4_PORTR|nr:hypothetical protein [Portunus trituberculatus]
MQKNLATVSKKRKRRFSETNPATLQVSEQQKLLLEEQLKVVKLQQQGEREKNEECMKLWKLKEEKERLKILLLKQELREGSKEEWV